MNCDFYEILQVPETSSIDEIKKSYRKLSMMYHPDKNNDPIAKEKFQKISEAYETLGDVDNKKKYDMMRNNPFIKIINDNSGDHSMEDILANIFGGIPFRSSFYPEPGNIRIFHNGIPINQTSMQKPTPIIKSIIVPIDKILTGTTIPVEIERWIIQNELKIFETETVYVTIPKGIDEGELIILKDKGNVVKDDCKGDIKLFIKIINDTDFKRSGLDLIYEKTISVKEALCGFTFELKYITGKVYTINNNSGNIISNGYRKIIPNMGFSREQHIGNLIIIFNIKFPEKISDDVMEKLKQIDF